MGKDQDKKGKQEKNSKRAVPGKPFSNSGKQKIRTEQKKRAQKGKNRGKRGERGGDSEKSAEKERKEGETASSKGEKSFR